MEIIEKPGENLAWRAGKAVADVASLPNRHGVLYGVFHFVPTDMMRGLGGAHRELKAPQAARPAVNGF